MKRLWYNILCLILRKHDYTYGYWGGGYFRCVRKRKRPSGANPSGECGWTIPIPDHLREDGELYEVQEEARTE